MATNGLFNRQLPIQRDVQPTPSFGDKHVRADARPQHNPGLAAGAVLSKRLRNYGDVVRHVQLVSRAVDATGQGIWTVKEITYDYANGNPVPGSATVGSQSTIPEAELNGAWLASSV